MTPNNFVVWVGDELSVDGIIDLQIDSFVPIRQLGNIQVLDCTNLDKLFLQLGYLFRHLKQLLSRVWITRLVSLESSQVEDDVSSIASNSD